MYVLQNTVKKKALEKEKTTGGSNSSWFKKSNESRSPASNKKSPEQRTGVLQSVHFDSISSGLLEKKKECFHAFFLNSCMICVCFNIWLCFKCFFIALLHLVLIIKKIVEKDHILLFFNNMFIILLIFTFNDSRNLVLVFINVLECF